LNYPKISIVTPCYNMVRYLEETIDSVLCQEYPNLEYIIIDGGSTDGSVDIIRKYERQLTYWVSEPDEGMYDAIQKGFYRSTGEIMAWINADDIYHKKAFVTVAKIFTENKKIEWITGRPSHLKSNGTILSVSDSDNRWSKNRIYCRKYKWIQQESTFWRRSLWEKAGARFDKKLKYAGDFGLWNEFFKYEKLYSVKALIGAFRVSGENQISQKFRDKYELEIANILDEEIKALNFREKATLVAIKSIDRYLLSLPIIRLSGKIDLLRKQIYKYPEYIKIND